MSKRIAGGVAGRTCDLFLDFSLGICNGRSDLGSPCRHLRFANNVTLDYLRGLSCRPGYRDITDYALTSEPHSLMKFYATGSNKVFVGAGSKVYAVDETTGYSEPTPPLTLSSAWWHDVNINSALVATQEGGTNPPMAYDGSSWLSMVFPTPDSTAMSVAAGAGGSVDAGTRLVRVRHLFANGASLTNGTKSQVITGGSGNYTIALTNIPTSARSDYIGFQIEIQKVGDSVTWWYVATVLSKVANSYNVTFADSSLGLAIPTEPGPYGQAIHFDNIAVFRGRLIGMVGSTLYPSRAVADVEAPGAGVFNFMASQSFPVTEFDDGDAIVTWAPQGDRLVVLKGKSGHALAGFDPSTFYMTPLFHGMGAASTRGACSHGSTVFFYDGGDRLFRLDGNNPSRWGKSQGQALAPDVSEYLQTITPSAESKVVLFNHLGSRIFVAYPANPSAYNNEALAFRTSDRRWEHHTNIRIADALVQARRDDFAGASVLWADPQVQSAPAAQSFAANPSFVAWTDGRVSQAQVYGQKVNSVGTPQLTANGVALSASVAGTPAAKVVVSDATGSGFVSGFGADQGGNSGFTAIYVQKTSSGGANQWGSGVLMSPAFAYSYNQTMLAAVQDGSGGIVVLWIDGNSSTLRIQRARSSDGAAQWTAGGVSVDTGITTTVTPRLIPDGAGGYYVVWVKSGQVKAQRFNSSGAAQWTAGGVSIGAANLNRFGACRTSAGGLFVVCPTAAAVLQSFTLNSSGSVTATSANLTVGVTSFDGPPYPVADDAGGAMIAYPALVTGQHLLAVIRVSAAGALLWSTTYLWTYNSGGSYAISPVSDGAGGIVVVWQDTNPAALGQVYAARVQKSGVYSWTAYLTPGVSATNPVACTDGAGGVIVAWQQGASSPDVYAQRVGSDGTIRWTTGGVAIAVATGTQQLAAIVFTNSPQAEAPAGSAPGYHLWAGWEGATDARPRSASISGTPIPWYAELPEHDAGEPDGVKEYEAIEIHAKRGIASVQAAVSLDAGSNNVAVPVSVSIAGAKWGGDGVVNPDTLYWGQPTGANPTQPHSWGGDTSGIARSGIPGGVIGRKHRLALSASVTGELIVTGIIIDYKRRPDRTFERTF